MIITFEDEGRKVQVSDNEIVQAVDVIGLCRDGMLAMGFHPDSVRDAIIEMAESLGENNEEA